MYFLYHKNENIDNTAWSSVLTFELSHLTNGPNLIIGLSPEDRVTLTKTYKLFVDNVPAEDVLDRLQQSQIIKFSDRQEILSYDKKVDRIQLLLQKVMNSKLPYALKALIDAIKFKYKKIYEQVVLVRKKTHKEGVVTKIGMLFPVNTANCLKRYK